MSICVVCTKGSDYTRKTTFSPTKVLPLPPRPPAPILDPPTVPPLLPDPTDPTDRPSSLTLLSVLISCIDHGDSPSYGILREVGEGTVCLL